LVEAASSSNPGGDTRVIDRLEKVFGEFREAEKNVLRELQRKQQEFYYEVRKGKVHFTEEARTRQKAFLKRLVRFLRDAPLLIGEKEARGFLWLCLPQARRRTPLLHPIC
jgi:hypothetical protein